MSKKLRPWAQDEAFNFYVEYGTGNCACHISPPCGSCTHPGNPLNLECTEDAWGWPHEVAAEEAMGNLSHFIETISEIHLSQMKLHSIAYEIDKNINLLTTPEQDLAHARLKYLVPQESDLKEKLVCLTQNNLI